MWEVERRMTEALRQRQTGPKQTKRQEQSKQRDRKNKALSFQCKLVRQLDSTEDAVSILTAVSWSLSPPPVRANTTMTAWHRPRLMLIRLICVRDENCRARVKKRKEWDSLGENSSFHEWCWLFFEPSLVLFSLQWPPPILVIGLTAAITLHAL